MLVVGEHANTYIENYSKEFLTDFIQLLSRRWGTKRVRANQVYQEFIQDKSHTHMNSTKWVTLTGFLQYLGKNGICHVDETEKGWFISWIDTSPKALAKQDAALKKERQDLGDEERQRRMINEQIERVKALEAAREQDGGEGSSAEPSTPAEEEEIDVTTIHPIKLSIGGFGNKGKQREDSMPTSAVESGSASPAPAPTDNLGSQLNGEQLNDAKPGESSNPQAILVSAEPVAVAAEPPKPKVNPLKMVGRSNPLKANPLKGKSSKSDHSASNSGNAPVKKQLTAMEQIALEEQERQKRRQNGGSGGRGGHNRNGFPPRH